MPKILRLVILILVLGGAAFGIWKWNQQQQASKPTDRVVLYGNADIRQVHLAFRGSDRIDRILIKEGDQVEKGQLLAQLDTSILQARVDQAQAELHAQQQILARLENGSRPEDIERAKANYAEAVATLKDANLKLEDTKEAFANGAASPRELDEVTARQAEADARVNARKAELDLVLAGPREEDILAARAQVKAAQAALDLATTHLDDAKLIAPANGIIRDRILEPGDMASPSKPALLLALSDPLWIRVYIEETDLGKIKPGMHATITTDSYPDRIFEGWVGYISPTAEFTPKPVESSAVRTSLVYEGRVFVKNPEGVFRLGMPATVTIMLDQDTDSTKADPTPAASPVTTPSVEG